MCVCLQHSADKCRCMKPIYSCRSFTWFNSRIRHPLYTLFSWFLLRSSKLNRDNTPHPSWIGNVLLEGNYNDIWQESNLIKMSSYIFFPFSFTIERTVVSIHLKSHLNSIWDYFLFSGRREGRHGRKGGEICGESTNQTTSGRRIELDSREKSIEKRKWNFRQRSKLK